MLYYMNILVLVKVIEKKMEINESDITALELGVRIKEKAGGRVEVVGVVADEELSYLYKGLYARGADNVTVYVTGSRAWESILQSAFLFKKIFLEDYKRDYIILGERSADTSGGVLAQVLAGLLEMPAVPFVKAVRAIGEDGSLELAVDMGGLVLLEVKPPVVLSVTREALKPRIPRLQDKIRTRGMKVNLRYFDGKEQIQSNLILKGLSKPPEPERKRIMVGGEEMVHRLAEIITEILG